MFTEDKPAPPLSTFIVRFWRELGASQVCWRGQVQHVQSGDKIAFADETALLSFLRRWVEMEETPALARSDESVPRIVGLQRSVRWPASK